MVQLLGWLMGKAILRTPQSIMLLILSQQLLEDSQIKASKVMTRGLKFTFSTLTQELIAKSKQPTQKNTIFDSSQSQARSRISQRTISFFCMAMLTMLASSTLEIWGH